MIYLRVGRLEIDWGKNSFHADHRALIQSDDLGQVPYYRIDRRVAAAHDASGEIASGPFYGFNRDGAKVSQGLIDNWSRQGLMGGSKAQYDCITALSATDLTEDLKAIKVPVLVMHGTDDQLVPFSNHAQRTVDLLKDGTLKTYDGLSHGMAATHPDVINADLLAFVRG
jgi:pimeloyl-ACP methyl ester carboxylesterase